MLNFACLRQCRAQVVEWRKDHCLEQVGWNVPDHSLLRTGTLPVLVHAGSSQCKSGKFWQLSEGFLTWTTLRWPTRYSQRLKSERWYFWRFHYRSVVKQFWFWTRPISGQNRLVCQTQNQFQTVWSWFGTGLHWFVRFSPKRLKSERLKTELNFVRFLKRKVWFSDVYCTL